MVDAFSKTRQKHANARLLLATAVPSRLRRIIAADPRIRVLGPLPHDQLLQHMAWADLFALPSWSEAFGMVYVEALCAGTPVLMTRDCGLAELLPLQPDAPAERAVGWKVIPRDVDRLAQTLDAILGDKHVLRCSPSHASDAAEQFTWHENASRLLDAVLAAPSSGQARERHLVGAVS